MIVACSLLSPFVCLLLLSFSSDLEAAEVFSEGEKYSVDSVIGGPRFAAAKATTALAKAKKQIKIIR